MTRFAIAFVTAALLFPFSVEAQRAVPSDAGIAPAPPQVAEPEAPLPPEHTPKISARIEPQKAITTGDRITLNVVADVLEGDDVSVPEQTFGTLDIGDKRARVEPAKDGRQRFVFEVDLIALEPGDTEVPPVKLRVVTKQGLLGSVATPSFPLSVKSVLGNEPNAEPKPPTAPVTVTQDDFTLLYVLGAILGAILVSLLTLWISRRIRNRVKPLPPPPPPRPPWDVATEKLAEIRRIKQSMLAEGRGVELVDRISDVVREYLGGIYRFDGLETTSDEMRQRLQAARVDGHLLDSVSMFLKRCDLVKFAKVTPDQDEVDLIFGKGSDLIHFGLGQRELASSSPAEAPSVSTSGQGPDNGGAG